MPTNLVFAMADGTNVTVTGFPTFHAAQAFALAVDPHIYSLVTFVPVNEAATV